MPHSPGPVLKRIAINIKSFPFLGKSEGQVVGAVSVWVKSWRCDVQEHCSKSQDKVGMGWDNTEVWQGHHGRVLLSSLPAQFQSEMVPPDSLVASPTPNHLSTNGTWEGCWSPMPRWQKWDLGDPVPAGMACQVGWSRGSWNGREWWSCSIPPGRPCQEHGFLEVWVQTPHKHQDLGFGTSSAAVCELLMSLQKPCQGCLGLFSIAAFTQAGGLPRPPAQQMLFAEPLLQQVPPVLLCIPLLLASVAKCPLLMLGGQSSKAVLVTLIWGEKGGRKVSQASTSCAVVMAGPAAHGQDLLPRQELPRSLMKWREIVFTALDLH